MQWVITILRALMITRELRPASIQRNSSVSCPVPWSPLASLLLGTSSSTQGQQITEVLAIGSVHYPGRLFKQKVSFIPFLFTPGKSSSPSNVSENDFLPKAPTQLLSWGSSWSCAAPCHHKRCHTWGESWSKCWVRTSKWPSRIPQELNHRTIRC